MFRKLLLTALVCCVANILPGQMNFGGKIVNESGTPLPGANVWLEYTNIGTSTDGNGNFSLTNVPEGEYVLRASSLNYHGARLQLQGSDSLLIVALKESSLKLNEVVVTGTGTLNRIKYSPVSVDIISQKELQNVSFPTFETTMTALSPSLSFTPNAMGSNMRFNGLSNRYVVIMVDGKRLAGDVGGNIDLSRIQMSGIKRIEILKGAASSLYGSEAIGGVINIITERPKEAVSVSTNTRYSEYGQFTQSINTYINSRWINSSTSYQRNQSGGWQLNPQELDRNGNLVDTYKQPVNPYYSDIFTQRFTVNANKALSLYAEGSLFDRKLKRSTDYKYDLKYEDYSIGAGAKYLLKDKGVINLDMYTDNFDYYKVHTVESQSNQVGDEVRERRQRYSDVNLKGVFYAGEQHRITGGTQYQVNYLNSMSDIADGARDIYTFSLYAQDEIRLFDRRLQIVPGMRYVYNETFKNKLTPKLAIMYSLNHFSFRTSYASGYKTPDLKYLFSNIESKAANGKTTLALGNKELNPETSDYYSLNMEYFNSFINISVSGYINKVKNLIKLVDVEPFPSEYVGQFDNVKLYNNASKVTIKGIDANLNTYLGQGVSLGAGYSYVDSKDHDTNKELEKVSRHTGTVQFNWLKRWWVVESNMNFNGRLQSKPYYKEEDGLGFSLWNLSTRHKFKSFSGMVLEPGFGIENLFNFVDDRPYGANYAILSPGRTVYISLVINFSK